MDYQRVYREFITDRRVREKSLTKGYERHHIVPRCLGGGNERSNLIRLTPSDHLFAHVLLARIHGGVLLTAAVRMSGVKRYQGRSTRKRYQFLRNQLSRDMAGNKRANAPKSDLHKQRIGQAHVGMKRSDEAKANMRAAFQRRVEKGLGPYRDPVTRIYARRPDNAE